MTPRVLSGVTPSGALTLGNYLGALKRFVEGQGSQHGFFFVADLHALTTPAAAGRVRELTRQTATLFFASGLDPEQSTVFVQSHVRAHAELSYLLESTAHVGELGRMIQFKEKGGLPGTRASLFTYPCLMAADILLYDTERVPVGGDQSQHVELCRDLATRFNRDHGDTFVVPQLAPAALATRVADLADPTVKMNKSAPDQAPGVVRMLDAAAVVRRKVGRAVTDSSTEVRFDRVERPGVSNLLEILASLVDGDPAGLAAGFSSYGALKTAVADEVTAVLEPIQQRYAALRADEARLDAMLAHGAGRAALQAEPVLARAKRAIGLLAAEPAPVAAG
ncbi:MAG: tryptophanyl-tRNA synthetase [Nocardioidaceae bacterium]|nr:tryptophanyl-tRNA synthetase [Nocardioidaceae bacterium]